MVKSLTDKNFVEETKDGVVFFEFLGKRCGTSSYEGPLILQI